MLPRSVLGIHPVVATLAWKPFNKSGKHSVMFYTEQFPNLKKEIIFPLICLRFKIFYSMQEEVVTTWKHIVLIHQ